MRKMKGIKKQEEALKKSVSDYAKKAENSKLISESALNSMIEENMANHYSALADYADAKADYKKYSKPFKNLVFTNFLPILISSTIALSTVGICYACRDKIGEKYDNYYAPVYGVEIESIDNVDFKLVKEQEYKIDQKQDKEEYYEIIYEEKQDDETLKHYNGKLDLEDGQRLVSKLEAGEDIRKYINRPREDYMSTMNAHMDQNYYFQISHYTQTQTEDFSAEKKYRTVKAHWWQLDDTREDSYSMPIKKKVRNWMIALEVLGFIIAGGLTYYNFYYEKYQDAWDDRKQFRSNYKTAKIKMKEMNK